MKTQIVSILIALIVVSCSGDKQKQLIKLRQQHDQISEQIKKLEDEMSKSGQAEQKNLGPRVAVQAIKPTTFDHYIEVQGKVDGDQSVNVFAEGLGGMVSQILAKEGQSVTKGQMLARIDDNLYQQNLKSSLATLDYVTAMYEKQKALWDQKIGSETQYLDIKSKKESLESSVAALRKQIDMCLIKAPVEGTVEDIPIKVGQLVGPGVIAFRVINLTSLKIVADIAEAYTSRINNGDKAIVYLPDLKKEMIGTIDFNSKYINPTNRTFQVIVRLNSVDRNLKANMIAVLKINDYKANEAMVVPINVVQTDLTGTYVALAVKSGTDPVVKKVPVVVGETYKGLTEIKMGLKTGDLVITAGYLALENGQNINY